MSIIFALFFLSTENNRNEKSSGINIPAARIARNGTSVTRKFEFIYIILQNENSFDLYFSNRRKTRLLFRKRSEILFDFLSRNINSIIGSIDGRYDKKQWDCLFTHLDRRVVGSFMTMTSVMSPYLVKYSLRLSETIQRILYFSRVKYRARIFVC